MTTKKYTYCLLVTADDNKFILFTYGENIRQYVRNYDNFKHVSFYVLFKLSGSYPLTYHQINTKEDVIRYEALLRRLFTILNNIGDSDITNLKSFENEYQRLIECFPRVFNVKVSDCSFLTPTLIESYTLSKNKRNIENIISVAKKIGCDITYHRSCDTLLNQCKNHLPIKYGVIQNDGKIIVFNLKNCADELKLYRFQKVRVNRFISFLRSSKLSFLIKNLNQ